MPIPIPVEGENEKDFHSRCMSSDVMQKEFPDQEQRNAVCYSQWRKHNKTSNVRTVYRTMNAMIIDNPSIENKSKSKTNRSRQDAYTAVAMVGDQFWNKGRTKEFCLFDGIKKGYKSMDKTFHNLDHGSDPHGSGHIRISDIVGIQDYTEVDEDSKQMIMYIFPDERMPSYGTWKAFIDMCQKNSKTPNVSIEAMVTQEQMKACDIPVKDLDYKSVGINEDDMVWVETDYRFVGAATVYMGACDDNDGCGIIDTNVSKQNCDYNTANISFNIIEEEGNMSETETIKVENKEEKTPSESNPQLKEIESLKTKLVDCGNLRTQITNENTELTKKIVELENKVKTLEETNKELNEKLSKPITSIEDTEKNLDKTEIGILALKKLMRK